MVLSSTSHLLALPKVFTFYTTTRGKQQLLSVYTTAMNKSQSQQKPPSDASAAGNKCL